jgi:bisphosphoglycerate-independent phosphoglycerate mutase (AlkP superfamily)
MLTSIKRIDLLKRTNNSFGARHKSLLRTYPGADKFVDEDILIVDKYPKSIPYDSDKIIMGNFTKDESSEMVKSLERQHKYFYMRNNTYYDYTNKE